MISELIWALGARLAAATPAFTLRQCVRVINLQQRPVRKGRYGESVAMQLYVTLYA